jgi:hypothetical protein
LATAIRCVHLCSCDGSMLRRPGCHRLAFLAKRLRADAVRSSSSNKLRPTPWSFYHEGAARGSLPLWAAAVLAATAATVGLAVREQQRSPAQSHYRRFQDFYKLLEKTSPLGLGVSLTLESIACITLLCSAVLALSLQQLSTRVFSDKQQEC